MAKKRAIVALMRSLVHQSEFHDKCICDDDMYLFLLTLVDATTLHRRDIITAINDLRGTENEIWNTELTKKVIIHVNYRYTVYTRYKLQL